MSRKVAVVAVHGVGQHAAGSSAEAVADLLVGLNCYAPQTARSPYSAFSVHQLDIPLPEATIFRSLHKGGSGKKSLWTSLRTMFEEKRGVFENAYTLNAWFSVANKNQRQAISQIDVASEFMKVQIEDYDGERSHSTYSTYRLEGRRAAQGRHPETDVHVYEMHWSDLSSPNNSFVRFFMAFYQLLLHLASLGRIAVNQVALEHTGKWDWFLYQRAYSYANRTLTLFVFNLLVVLPVVAFAPLVLLLNTGAAAKAVAVTIVFVGTMGGVLVCSQRWSPSFGARGWWPISLAVALICIGVAGFVLSMWSNSLPFLLTIEWWLIAISILGFWVFPNYDQVRNGALQVGWILVLAAAAGFFYLTAYRGAVVPEHDLKAASFLMIQYVLLALRLSWIVFILLSLLAGCMELICMFNLRGAGNEDKRARARSAARTGRFTIAVASTLLMVVSIFLWCGVYYFFSSPQHVNLFRGLYPKDAYLYHIVLGPRETDVILRTLGEPSSLPSAAIDPYRFFEGMLLESAHPGLPIILGLDTLALLLFALIVLPSVYREINPTLSAQNGKSTLLGAWLSGGLSSLRTVIALFWISGFIIPILYLLIAFLSFHRSGGWAWCDFDVFLYEFRGMHVTKIILDKGGALFAGSATLLIGLLLKYASPILDTILDVDNYLRTSPATNTPRARIVERYLSLFRYLHDFRDANGLPYERIVIIAHSLGSLISADLLRFLVRRECPTLTDYAFAGAGNKLPLYFFTMGNPLRQLLNRFFPDLYRWIRERPDAAGEPFSPSCPVPVPGAGGVIRQGIPSTVTPDASDLGVQQWRNSYRSGDYVGRSVWLNDWYTRTGGSANSGGYPQNLSADSFSNTPVTCIESCIGLGAHTHYWDRTAPDIAEQLDVLIVV